jgi:hypothetical protein
MFGFRIEQSYEANSSMQSQRPVCSELSLFVTVVHKFPEHMNFATHLNVLLSLCYDFVLHSSGDALTHSKLLLYSLLD